MKSLDAIQSKIQENMEHIKSTFHVESLAIFGSVVRNEANQDSDVDILVSFKPDADMYHMLELEIFLSDLLGVEVDVVSKRAVRREFRDQILKEAVTV